MVRNGSLVRHAATALVAATCALLVPAGARAQGTQGPQGSQGLLAGARLDAASRAAILALIDSARADGLPVEPLVSKTLEGSSKGAPPARIVTVVRIVHRALGDARAALGAAAPEAELVAGAAALQAGLGPQALAELRRARAGRPLAGPLVVAADLVARGVPPAAAGDAVLRLARANAADATYATLRRDVERDIAAGAAPATAAALRAGGLAGRVPPATTRPDAALPEAP